MIALSEAIRTELAWTNIQLSIQSAFSQKCIEAATEIAMVLYGGEPSVLRLASENSYSEAYFKIYVIFAYLADIERPNRFFGSVEPCRSFACPRVEYGP